MDYDAATLIDNFLSYENKKNMPEEMNIVTKVVRTNQCKFSILVTLTCASTSILSLH